ncbi:MAG: bifunctional alpha/beta hydrolase/OsmC family protein [Rhodobacteraceae bacterium]|nr:bifunctional alpha/beta hydrolase/OsmC family protein [Paracoccaceae bacterium]
MPSEKLTFTGHTGAELAALFDKPNGPVLATAIFAHCFTCSKDILAAKRISQRLASAGIAVLRFDFTGLGQSGGEFTNTDFTSNVGDLVSAAAHMDSIGMPVRLLVGHSLGGAAVLKAAGDIASVKAVVTIGAPSDPAHVTANFGCQLDEINKKGSAEVSLAGRGFTITKAFLDDIASAELLPAIAAMKKALLVLHAPSDGIVSIDNASEIFLAAKHPKSFITLDKADHLLSKAEDAQYAADVIASWAARYLDLPKPAAPIGAPEGIVRVSEADVAGFRQDIAAGPKHHVTADEPVAYGGTDDGFTPYQLVSAGLGACTSMTIRMYARRKKWPLEHVSVDITHDKIHVTDCQHCETVNGKIDQFKRVITLEGDLDADQRQRLMAIADKCPVHRTLHNEVEVLTVEAAPHGNV